MESNSLNIAAILMAGFAMLQQIYDKYNARRTTSDAAEAARDKLAIEAGTVRDRLQFDAEVIQRKNRIDMLEEKVMECEKRHKECEDQHKESTAERAELKRRIEVIETLRVTPPS